MRAHAIKQVFRRIYYEDLKDLQLEGNFLKPCEILLLTFKNFPDFIKENRYMINRDFIYNTVLQRLITKAYCVYMQWSLKELELIKGRYFAPRILENNYLFIRRSLIKSYIEHATSVF